MGIYLESQRLVLSQRNCLGLVKGRLNQGFGLRFKASDFVDSWKKDFSPSVIPLLTARQHAA